MSERAWAAIEVGGKLTLDGPFNHGLNVLGLVTEFVSEMNTYAHAASWMTDGTLFQELVQRVDERNHVSGECDQARWAEFAELESICSELCIDYNRQSSPLCEADAEIRVYRSDHEGEVYEDAFMLNVWGQRIISEGDTKQIREALEEGLRHREKLAHYAAEALRKIRVLLPEIPDLPEFSVSIGGTKGRSCSMNPEEARRLKHGDHVAIQKSKEDEGERIVRRVHSVMTLASIRDVFAPMNIKVTSEDPDVGDDDPVIVMVESIEEDKVVKPYSSGDKDPPLVPVGIRYARQVPSEYLMREAEDKAKRKDDG